MDRTEQLRVLLPDVYAEGSTLDALCRMLGPEFGDYHDALQAVLRQFYAPSADDWGLDLWEEALAIPPSADDEATRRARVLARLRAPGTTTHQRILSVANSFENGQVVVIEDFAAYALRLRFVDVRGVPPNLDDVERAVREILPAHLVLTIEFTYVTWDMVDDLDESWDTFDARGITHDEMPTFIGGPA